MRGGGFLPLLSLKDRRCSAKNPDLEWPGCATPRASTPLQVAAWASADVLVLCTFDGMRKSMMVKEESSGRDAASMAAIAADGRSESATSASWPPPPRHPSSIPAICKNVGGMENWLSVP